jgi:hypothetical protein
MADIVELIEADALAAGGGKEAHRDRDQPECQVAFPDRSGHGEAPFWHQPALANWPQRRVFKVSEQAERMQAEMQ